MELPELYRKVAYLPKRDAKQYLEEFTREGKWKENARVLDIGCGDGSTSVEVLKQSVPSCKSIVACDISDKMINYAKKNYGHERVEFLQWDVTEAPPLQMRCAFQHVFSFYTLHWVKKQQSAFMNIYQALAEGGNCLLMFLGRYTVYEVFRTLSRTLKWADDLKNVEMFTSPYHGSQNIEAEVTKLMLSAGFKDIQVRVEEKSHVYENEDIFKSLVMSVNPFHNLNEKWDDFMKDFFKVSPSPKVDYQLIVVYGYKAAFMNIYNTMAEGGNCLLVFLGRSDVHDTFVKLSKTEKWREDLMDVGKFISPYFHSQDPGGEVTNLMKKVGFKEVQVKVQETVYTYESMDALGNLVKALNPFSVLNEKWEEFMTDYFKTSPSPLTVHRKLIVAYGAKY